MTGMGRQLRDNLVAITSLVVALSALGYNTWRNERTERNRNVRTAGIELLQEIGSLQQIVFYVNFTEEDELEDPRGKLRMGWVDVFSIGDLAAVMPPDVTSKADNLRRVWEADVRKLEPHDADEEALAGDGDAAFRRIDGAIEELRQATLTSLRALN